MAVDIFALTTLGNIVSSISGGSGDILKDMLGDNPISTAKEKAADTAEFLFSGPRKFGTKETDGGAGLFDFDVGLDLDLSAGAKKNQEMLSSAASVDIVSQLLSGTFDITKL